MDMNQYLDIFIEESKEHLQNMNESLLSLEKTANDKNLLNEIFRVAHTLKGMSATMGFVRIASLTHEMENLLHAIRNDEIEVSSHIIDVLFECFDTLEGYVSHIAENGEENSVDSNHLVKALNDILNHRESDLVMNTRLDTSTEEEVTTISQYILPVLHKAKEKGLYPYTLKIILSEDCMLKAARAFIIFNSLESHSEIIQSNPPVDDIEDEKFDREFTLKLVSSLNKDDINKELMSILEIDNVEIHDIIIDDSDFDKSEIGLEIRNIDEEEHNSSNDNLQSKKKQNGKIGKTVRVSINNTVSPICPN